MAGSLAEKRRFRLNFVPPAMGGTRSGTVDLCLLRCGIFLKKKTESPAKTGHPFQKHGRVKEENLSLVSLVALMYRDKQAFLSVNA
jgi:hypothetical protein